MSNAGLAQENLGPTLLITAWILAAVATAVVFTRYYIRMRVLRRTSLDDWLILLTLVG